MGGAAPWRRGANGGLLERLLGLGLLRAQAWAGDSGSSACGSGSVGSTSGGVLGCRLVDLRQRLPHLGAHLVDAEAHQRGDVLIALLALREQPEHRPLVVGERHGSRSLRQTEGPHRAVIRLRCAPMAEDPRGLHSNLDALVGTEWLDDDPDHARVRLQMRDELRQPARPAARRRDLDPGRERLLAARRRWPCAATG